MKNLPARDLITRFDELGNSSRVWRSCATDLLNASRTLVQLFYSAIEEDPPKPAEATGYLRPALMLRAMAFECLLKARALDRQMTLAKDGQYAKIPGCKDHDLVALAHAVRFRVTDRQRGVLRRLSRYVASGRYPIARRWTEQLRLTADGKVELLSAGWHPDWDVDCDRMLARLQAKSPATKR